MRSHTLDIVQSIKIRHVSEGDFGLRAFGIGMISDGYTRVGKQPSELTILNRGPWSVGRGVVHGLGSSKSYDSTGEWEEGGDDSKGDGVGTGYKESEGGREGDGDGYDGGNGEGNGECSEDAGKGEGNSQEGSDGGGSKVDSLDVSAQLFLGEKGKVEFVWT
ncbi:hypothetical protein M0802_012288 [Mischocyttarus mexicanus]|nr:hypothetical protein M0802_012288 [Mischocyttarus mexicanus]